MPGDSDGIYSAAASNPAIIEDVLMPKPFRRVVTGHNQQGAAIIQSDAPPTRVQVFGENGPTFYEVWNTRETPAVIDRDESEPFEGRLTLVPPIRGTRIRVLDIPPETE